MTDRNTLRARAHLALRAERAWGVGQIIRPSQSQSDGVSTPVDMTIQNVPQRFVSPTVHGTQASSKGSTKTKTVETSSSLDSTQTFSQSLLILPDKDIPLETPILPREEKIRQLRELDTTQVRGCMRCRLHAQRTHTVFGEGDPDAMIFFIGEGPGANEDLQGRPFVGRAGELLDKQIRAMGLSRQQVYIANIVKCRPPGNREPAPDEVATCTPYLERQIEIVRPRVIVTLGRPAAQHLLQTKQTMTALRGRWHEWRGIKVMPTFHPAYILRNYTREVRSAVWSDLQAILSLLGLPIPGKNAE